MSSTSCQPPVLQDPLSLALLSVSSLKGLQGSFQHVRAVPRVAWYDMFRAAFTNLASLTDDEY